MGFISIPKILVSCAYKIPIRPMDLTSHIRPRSINLVIISCPKNIMGPCARHIVCSVGQYNVICYDEANFLQLILWERIAHLALEQLEFEQFPL